MTPYEPRSENGRTPSDELAWTAFQYSVGELSEGDAALFETRLETDASAQAALAQAVALSAGVKLAEAESPMQASPSPTQAIPARSMPLTIAAGRDENFGRRAAGWMLLATAASVALWFALSQPRGEQRRETAKVVSEAQRELAAAWVAGQPSDEELVIVDEPMTEEELQAELDAYPVIEEPSAPDWLIAALVEQKISPERGDN